MSRPAVFLDRDGTLLEGTGYHADPSGVRLVSGAAQALADLKAAGFALVVLTNQSGVARGLFACADVEATHARAAVLFGGLVDGWYYCPHHPELGQPPWRASCSCRKPAPGLMLRACRELDLDLVGSFAVGDQLRDLELFSGTPVRTILVLTGRGRETLGGANDAERLASPAGADLGLPGVDRVLPDLVAAAAWILEGAP